MPHSWWLSEISIKIGIDFGKNTVVRYGADEKMAYVDLLGPTLFQSISG